MKCARKPKIHDLDVTVFDGFNLGVARKCPSDADIDVQADNVSPGGSFEVREIVALKAAET